MNMYGRYNYWQSLYENNWTFTFYCHKNFVNCSTVFIFYLTARIRLNLVRAVEIFLSSSWHFEKKCRAVEIRADGFRAVHPDSIFLSLFLYLSCDLRGRWEKLETIHHYHCHSTALSELQIDNGSVLHSNLYFPKENCCTNMKFTLVRSFI